MILSALKHPLRRKILRMLSDKPLSFSEILEAVSIDSGHLNYHIKNMGDIVIRTEDGKYALSSVGYAAIELVGKVEEQDKSNRTNKRAKRVSRLALVFSAIFAIALLTASVYALTFTTQDQGTLFKANQEIEMIPVRIEPDQAFNYNTTLNQLSFGSGYGSSIGQQQTLVWITQRRNDFSEWTRYFSNTQLRVNGNYAISISVYNPEGNTVSQRREDGIIDVAYVSLDFKFSTLGNYRLHIENLRSEKFNATIIPSGTYIVYEKPLFNYGIAGLIVLIIYPVLFILSWNWNKKLRSKRTGSNPPSLNSSNKLSPC